MVTPWGPDPLAHTDHPWLRVTPDAGVLCGRLQGFGECKCPRRIDPEKWTEPDENKPSDDLSRWGVPLHYAYQGQTQLGVARAAGLPVDVVWYPVLGREGGFGVWVLEHSEEAWQDILARLVAWHERHIICGEPCPSQTRADALRRHPAPNVPSVTVSPAIEWALRQRVQLLAERRQIDAQLERLDGQILDAVGSAVTVYGPDGRVGWYDRRRVFRPDPEWKGKRNGRERHEPGEETE